MCFLCMIHVNDTGCEPLKYVDDTTIYNVTSCTNNTALQKAVDLATDWSSKYDMHLNATKRKISFAKVKSDIPNIVKGTELVDCVHHCTFLLVQITDT